MSGGHDLDEVADLDDPTDPTDPTEPGPAASGGDRGRWADRAPRLRSRWVLPAAVAVAVLVLVAGAGAVRQARSAAVDELRAAQRVAAVQLSGVLVSYDGGRPDVDDHLVVTAQLPVANNGRVPVEVVLRGASFPHAALLPPQEERPLVVPAARSGVLPLQLSVDCAGVPPQEESGLPAPAGVTAQEQWADLGLSFEGVAAGSEHRLVVPASQYGSLTSELSYLCDPQGSAVSASTSRTDDGHLLVRATNTTSEAARLVLVAPPQLRVTSEPPLPLDLPAGGSVTLRLTTDPSCADVPPPSRSPGEPEVYVAQLLDGGEQSLSYDGTSPAWVARQVALACG